MKTRVGRVSFLILSAMAVLPIFLSSQGTPADYERAAKLRDKVQFLALDVVDRSGWIEKTSRFWYRKTVPGGAAFEVMDAATLAKKPAFDHQKLAAALSAAAGEKYSALSLPFQAIAFVENETVLEFDAGESKWRCALSDYSVKKVGPAARRRPGAGASPFAPPPPPSLDPKASPDGKWEAFVKNYNIWVRSKDKKVEFPLSWEGTEGDAYLLSSIAWSPDSKKIAAYRVRPGYRRVLQYVESSPADQLQPKVHTYAYPKPGDALDVCTVALFQVEAKKRFLVDPSLIPNGFWIQGVGPNPRQMPDAAWWKDSRAFTFEYNQRGHQVYRIIEVDAATGKARPLVDETNKTFISYSYKKYRYDAGDGAEIIWMSERDGWNHLYLYDGRTGTVKNPITKGEWVVRGVDKVDEAARQVWFRAGGIVPGQDPYLIHSCRVNFDGTGLAVLTEGNGNHAVAFSADMKYFVDTWSRVDLPPVTELRSTADRKLLAVVEKADVAGLLKTGWRMPEVYTAKGRDGTSDVWGLILRPTNFDPKKKYPVIEYIYAGPHDSFVPKSFFSWHAMQSLAELGFIVAQVDGMGTSNRSKAFHDVCWKDIGDAGFPDRILWHKAVAAKYPYYDISRVGIYGGSAGGQNSTGGVLFHPEFYKVAVSFAGCHDNRMDKLWWNEAWMSWPLGPEYAASSNVDNAYRLQGKLLLIVGELDTNVDPASTMQVVNALIKANKIFDLLVIPGGSHGAGRSSEVPEYGERKRNDFFVRNLLGVEPPDWNRAAAKK